ncbi:MAG: HAD-IB family hydrolase [Alphaproteobacteria bacterium]|nr:HAD-IB family hydrolase [Alphaproteobacteria bacterium]MCB9695611.1 HAD-IB family hydrolase [Alphaproteobacteria bacterium]
MTGIALFDLDRTLLDCNSGRLWAMAEWRAGRITSRDLAWAMGWLVRYGLGFEGGLNQAMEAAATTIIGETEEALDARVRRWFDHEVRHRLRPGARTSLQRHRERGDRLVLATSGSIYAARAAADAFGLDEVVATTFEVVDGRFTGRIEVLAIADGKTRAVREWAERTGADLARASFYTDSASDRTLLEVVGDPRVVHPDRALRRIAGQKGWPIEDWGAAS